LVVERAVASARHLVVGVIGDGEGNVLHLGTHERSLALPGEGVRVRECPVAGVSAEALDRLQTLAVRVASALRYLGVGGVEFLVGADGRPWFFDFDPGLPSGFGLHDAAFGLSLVGAQIQIAAGESLGWTQADIASEVHAIELLLRATGSGTLEEFAFPEGVHVATRYAAGAQVDSAHDPWLACVRVVGPTRSATLVRAKIILENSRIEGVPHDTEALLRLLEDPRMWRGETPSALMGEMIGSS
jgi:acetyl/propionyl-CoA carboxylase alpha subunit